MEGKSPRFPPSPTLGVSRISEADVDIALNPRQQIDPRQRSNRRQRNAQSLRRVNRFVRVLVQHREGGSLAEREVARCRPQLFRSRGVGVDGEALAWQETEGAAELR